MNTSEDEVFIQVLKGTDIPPTPVPFTHFRPSLTVQIGYNTLIGRHYLYTFVAQKQRDSTSNLFEREYRSLRFKDLSVKIDQEPFIPKPDDTIYGNSTNTSIGHNLVLGVSRPSSRLKGPGLSDSAYAVFYSVDKRIEFCFQWKTPSNGSLLDREVSPYS